MVYWSSSWFNNFEMVGWSNDKKLRLKKVFIGLGFGCDFIVPLFYMETSNLARHQSLTSSTGMWKHLMHSMKQFKMDPYCTWPNLVSLNTHRVYTWSRPYMTPLYLENWVLMVGYFSGRTTPGKWVKRRITCLCTKLCWLANLKEIFVGSVYMLHAHCNKPLFSAPTSICNTIRL